MVALLAACAPSHRSAPAPIVAMPPGRWDCAPCGVSMWVPAWLDLAPELRDQAELEVEAAHVPSGYAVVVMDPGAFSTIHSPTGLARGLTDFQARVLYVAWRFPARGRGLPALAHEVRNAETWETTHDAERVAAVDREP